MKLQMLKYFVTLAESCSISEAAQKLYVAQPSLSKSLQLLEKELGFPLFSRTKTGIVLTEEGKQILPEAKQILVYYDGWKQIGRTPSLRKLDIYTHYSFPDFILPKAIFQVRKQHPELAINYSVSMSPEKHISRSVQEPILALFLCHGPEGLAQCAQLQGDVPLELMQGSYCCLVSAQSPLARRPGAGPERGGPGQAVFAEVWRRALIRGRSGACLKHRPHIVFLLMPTPFRYWTLASLPCYYICGSCSRQNQNQERTVSHYDDKFYPLHPH